MVFVGFTGLQKVDSARMKFYDLVWFGFAVHEFDSSWKPYLLGIYSHVTQLHKDCVLHPSRESSEWVIEFVEHSSCWYQTNIYLTCAFCSFSLPHGLGVFTLGKYLSSSFVLRFPRLFVSVETESYLWLRLTLSIGGISLSQIGPTHSFRVDFGITYVLYPSLVYFLISTSLYANCCYAQQVQFFFSVPEWQELPRVGDPHGGRFVWLRIMGVHFGRN